VFGTASTAEKRRFAERLGADHTIDYESMDFRDIVAERTEAGVEIVFDGVGGETFDRSIDAARPFGRVVTLGNAGGTDATPDAGRLRAESVHVVGYHLSRAVERFPGRVHRAAAEVFGLPDAGGLEFVVGRRFDLSEAGAAHAHIESRESHGKVLLVPRFHRESRRGPAVPDPGRRRTAQLSGRPVQGSGMTIVVAVDGTELDDPAVATGYDLARAYGVTLHVLHVVPEEEFEAHLDEIQSLDREADYSLTQEENSARRLARDLVEGSLDDWDPDTVEPMGRVGDPTEEVLAAADELDARHVVVGGRRRSPVGKALFGSTTQEVLLESDRPVITVMRD
jgi:nucleotide-binding universal stress UspA family protein